MDLKSAVASVALLACGASQAAYHPQPTSVERLQSKIDRNQNSYYAESSWYNRIMFSGLAQVYGFATTNSEWASGAPIGGWNAAFAAPERAGTDLWLSRANLYLDINVNDWTEVHMAFDLANTIRAVDGPTLAAFHSYAQYDERRYVGSRNINAFAVPDEAYITIGNFAESDYYLRAGREYIRFGNYKRNVVPATFTQLMTQTQADAIEIGFVDMHRFNGALYAFRSTARSGTENHVNNVGAQLGYVWENGDVITDLTADWLYDISAVNYIAALIGPGGGLTTPPSSRRVGGLSFTALINYNQFDFKAQYASSDHTFNALDLRHNTSRAFPIAWMLGAGYRFGIMNNDDAHIGLNFQMTHEALGFGLPEYRVQGDFTLEIWKNLEASLTLVYDADYSASDVARVSSAGANNRAGTGRDTISGLLGLTAQFA